MTGRMKNGRIDHLRSAWESRSAWSYSRAVLPLVASFLYGWINFLLNPGATLLTAQSAGKQFENSDASFIGATIGMGFFSHLGIPFAVLLGVLIVIWWRRRHPLPRRRPMLSRHTGSPSVV